MSNHFGSALALSAALWLWLAIATAISVRSWARWPARVSRGYRSQQDSRDEPPITLIRACAGEERHLSETLATYPKGFAKATSSPTRRVIFAVESASDAAAPVAEEAASLLRGHGISASCVSTGARGPNHKVDQLARVMIRESSRAPSGTSLTTSSEGEGPPPRKAPPPNSPALVMVADSDVALDTVDMNELLAQFDGPNVGAVWVPPVEVEPPETWGDRASQALLSGSLHSFPLLAALAPEMLVGKVMMVRTDALSSAGGFESLVHHLGEDLELARRLKASGWAIVAARGVARSRACGRPLRLIFDRYTRWLCVIRAQRPRLLATYPLFFSPLPFFLPLAALASPVVGAVAFTAAVGMVALRVSTAFAARMASGTSPRRALAFAWMDVVLAEGLLLVAWSRALFARTVRWRAGTLRLDPSGLLLPQRDRTT